MNKIDRNEERRGGANEATKNERFAYANYYISFVSCKQHTTSSYVSLGI